MRIQSLFNRFAIVILTLAVAPPAFAADTNPFFAMDTALRDGKERTAVEQAALLKQLGYDGFGTHGYPSEEFLRAFEKEGLTVFNTYLSLSFDSAKPGLDPELKESITRLKGHNTDLWIAIQAVTKDGVKLKPSATEGDEVVVPVLRELADLANASGVKIALYPHTWFWLERVEDALRITRKSNRSNVGVTFNLCHWLKVEGNVDPKPILKEAMPNLLFVSINGADSGETKKMDWSRLIQPLDVGTYDVGSLLKSLRELGYRGPIGFQGYGIKGDSEEILRRTMKAWRQLEAR
jgi:sugar phosphate isomerase/epimerase